MSILIKDMKMPKNCLLCYCTDTEYGECVLDPKKRCPEDYGQRAEWCPLISVPPHGRLIDADALLERFEKEEKAADEHGRDFSFSFKSGGENCTEWWPVQQMLMDAPTILEAEVSE